MRGLGKWYGLLVLSGALVGPLRARVPIVVPPDTGRVMHLAAREIRRYVYLRTDRLLPVEPALPGRGEAIELVIDPSLAPQQYRLQTQTRKDLRVLSITGGTDIAVLYGSYRLAEILGVRFYLHDDVIPDEKIQFRLPDLDEIHRPLFDLRGILPFHDFPEGPDWWNADDYKAYLAQIVKLRMNFFGLHTYPEGHPHAEPTVWIGLARDIDDRGRVRKSYPSTYANTRRGGKWGYLPMKTRDFCAGAAALFETDDWGPEVLRDEMPAPTTDEGMNAVFNRTGDMLRGAFRFGRSLGIKICLGTETPLTVPAVVQQHLRDMGLDPQDDAVVQQLYAGMFERIKRSYPIDYYWLWTPEAWTWHGAGAGEVEATMRTIGLARSALKETGAPFGLATCGWVLGPPTDRTLFDTSFPLDVALSCINRQVGFAPVEPGFSRIENRAHWAIPWMEDDPGLILPQLWAGRMRRDAADALAYGCTGLMGIHWRTKILSPNIAALAAAAWEQRGWNPEAGERPRVPEAKLPEGRVEGTATESRASPITGAEVMAGQEHDVRRINRGAGPADADERDPLDASQTLPSPDRPRDMPIADFYRDWCAAQFGTGPAAVLGSLFTRLDGGEDPTGKRQLGTLPRPATWLHGPGGIKPNAIPWDVEKRRYAFVDDMAALRGGVTGAGSLQRFDYWLNTFRYLRYLGELGCRRGALDKRVKEVEKAAPESRQMLAENEILPLRLELARLWERTMTTLLLTVDTPGALGNVANMEQHNRQRLRFLTAHDEKIRAWLGRPLPAAIQLSAPYTGTPRVIVPTRRTHLEKGSPLALRVLLLDEGPGAAGQLYWRGLGETPFKSVPLRRVERQVYRVTLPPMEADFEYYLDVHTARGDHLRWPVTAPQLNRTVVLYR